MKKNIFVTFLVLAALLLGTAGCGAGRKIKGEYTYEDESGQVYTAIFYDGRFMLYEPVVVSGEGRRGLYLVGVYHQDGKKIELLGIECQNSFNITDCSYDPRSDSFIRGEKTYVSTDPERDIEYTYTEAYAKDLEEKIRQVVSDMVRDLTTVTADTVNENGVLQREDLKYPQNPFTRDLADKIDYNEDLFLQFLMENQYLQLNLSMTRDGKLTVTAVYCVFSSRHIPQE